MSSLLYSKVRFATLYVLPFSTIVSPKLKIDSALPAVTSVSILSRTIEPSVLINLNEIVSVVVFKISRSRTSK